MESEAESVRERLDEIKNKTKKEHTDEHLYSQRFDCRRDRCNSADCIPVLFPFLALLSGLGMECPIFWAQGFPGLSDFGPRDRGGPRIGNGQTYFTSVQQPTKSTEDRVDLLPFLWPGLAVG